MAGAGEGKVRDHSVPTGADFGADSARILWHGGTPISALRVNITFSSRFLFVCDRDMYILLTQQTSPVHLVAPTITPTARCF